MLAPSSTEAGEPTMAQGIHEQSTPAPEDRDPERLRRPGVEVSYAEDLPIVAVTGQVDHAKVTDVSGTVRGLIAVGVTDLVVDLTRSWDGAALLPVLARRHADLADRGGTLRLVGVALPEFLAALAAAPLDEVFLVYEAVRRNSDDSRSRRQRPRAAGSVRRRTDWSP
jgi:hypothetical protein